MRAAPRLSVDPDCCVVLEADGSATAYTGLPVRRDDEAVFLALAIPALEKKYHTYLHCKSCDTRIEGAECIAVFKFWDYSFAFDDPGRHRQITVRFRKDTEKGWRMISELTAQQ